MLVVGRNIVDEYLAARPSHKGIDAAGRSFRAWFLLATAAQWSKPTEVTAAHPKASILKAGRVVFNIKGNDFRLITSVQYEAGIVTIHFFGSHAEYDAVDAEAADANRTGGGAD